MKLKQMMIVSPYMENIMINTNPFHNFCVALVVAAQIELQSWASQQGIKTTISQICARSKRLLKKCSLAKVCVFYSPSSICFLYCVG
jgi:long-subunit acyl-CoA synthetase (AMP-forming)